MANSGNRTVFIGNIPYGECPKQPVLWLHNENMQILTLLAPRSIRGLHQGQAGRSRSSPTLSTGI